MSNYLALVPGTFANAFLFADTPFAASRLTNHPRSGIVQRDDQHSNRPSMPKDPSL